MDCQTVKPLLHAYLDGELGVSEVVALELHLQSCPLCEAEAAGPRSLSQAFKQDHMFYKAPANLRSWAEEQVSLPRVAISSRNARTMWSTLGGLAAGIALTLAAVRSQLVVPDTGLAQQLIDDHIRSLAADHLTDVASNDQHNVKPWFNGKLDFAPVVINPTADGYPLVGGRIDVVEGRRVAALVYQRRQHYINVIERLWTKAGDVAIDHQGYHLRQWSQEGLQFSVVSELDPLELDQFIKILRHK